MAPADHTVVASQSQGARHYASVSSQAYVVQMLAQYLALAGIESVPPVCHVLCMDPVAQRVLESRNLPGLRCMPVEDLEGSALLACKSGRSQAEYCWTLKPHFLRHLLQVDSTLEQVVYLDADLYPFASVDPLWDQLCVADIVLSPHRFTEGLLFQMPVAGFYNAGMVGIRNTVQAREALDWWCERCREWCFARPEDGKLGDQKYLESLAEQFHGVVDCQDVGINVAPWNIGNFKPVPGSPGVRLDVATKLRLYHFHQYGVLPQGGYLAVKDPSYAISVEAHELIYEPYTAALVEALVLAQEVESGITIGVQE